MVSSSSHKIPKVQQVQISSESAGQRLDNFLFTYLKGVPKTRIYRIIRKGEVRINKGRIKPEYRLVSGDILRLPPVRQGEERSAIELSQNDKLAHSILDQILYEDEGLLVINKPAGIAVHGGSGVSFGVIEAVRYLRGSEKSLELVHRLDKDTSGCLMIAKRRKILRAIHEQLQAGDVEKVYWALVQGRWQGGESVSAPLKKNQLSSGERVVRVSEDGQPSLTEFKVLQAFPSDSSSLTLMEAKPKTGRTHQIRVHAAHVGNPIVGDPKYGDNHFNTAMKQKGLSRLFLHAQKLTLTLPGHEKPISVEAPLDKQLQTSLDKLAKEIHHG
ncbi:MAG TPA: 23S rRNA pseudouridine(955/2504/2580) synthase RluC [Gammaproteobacteria bacterium]|nr:23S rRNA pseudouridine(955/2504/2580) synthase RluC [Gammaproteobacteria bacterium]